MPCLVHGQSPYTHLTAPNPGIQGFPSTLTGLTTPFSSMVPREDGAATYVIQAVLGKIKPGIQHPSEGEDPNPPLNMVYYTQYQTLYSFPYFWAPNPGSAPLGFFTWRDMAANVVVAGGHVTQSQINSLGTPSEEGPLLSLGFRESSIAANGNGSAYTGIGAGDRREGTLNLVADVPNSPTGVWRLGITSALGEERFAQFSLLPGPQILQATGVEAGNCLVSLTAINGNNATAGTYHREVPVLVRKNAPGLASMQFATTITDPRRFRLHSLALGQNSQIHTVDQAALGNAGQVQIPLQQNKTAMIRVMAYDAFGEGGAIPTKGFTFKLTATAPGKANWTTTFLNFVGTRPVKTGRGSDPVNVYSGPEIPAAYIQPGMQVVAQLINPTSGIVLDTLTINPEVIRPRKIFIHGFDVRPYRGDSGCPLARSPEQVKAWVLPYVQEVFPYSEVYYQYDGKVWLMDYGTFTSRGLVTNAVAMVLMNVFQGMHQTDLNAETEHLYLALINQSYGSTSFPGMAWYGYRGIALTRIDGGSHPGGVDARLGYLLAHEMGHCFGLEHAPSDGAASGGAGPNVNRVDGNFPYGGAGMAGGWGYSALGSYFLSEDAHTFESGQRAHWDTMSYTRMGMDNERNNRFSDYHAARLKPQGAWTAPGYVGTPTDSPVSLVTLPSGVLVFDSVSASQAKAWFQSALPSMAPMQVRNLTAAVALPAGVDPSQGDPDDPTPPVLIVTQSPAIPGVTVLP